MHKVSESENTDDALCYLQISLKNQISSPDRAGSVADQAHSHQHLRMRAGRNRNQQNRGSSRGDSRIVQMKSVAAPSPSWCARSWMPARCASSAVQTDPRAGAFTGRPSRCWLHPRAEVTGTNVLWPHTCSFRTRRKHALEQPG